MSEDSGNQPISGEDSQKNNEYTSHSKQSHLPIEEQIAGATDKAGSGNERIEFHGVVHNEGDNRQSVNLEGTIKKDKSNEEQAKLAEDKYKKEQQQRIQSIVVGARDYTGNTITKVFSRSDEYAIYEIKTPTIADSIKVIIDSIKEDDETLTRRFDEVRVSFSKIKGFLYKVNDDTSVKTRIAHIIAHALCGQTAVANNEFDKLIEEINLFYREQFNNRLRYLVTILFTTFLLIGYSIYVYTQRIAVDLPLVRSMIFVVTAGSIGGVLSVSRRLKRTLFEKDVHWALYIIYGFERTFIAISGAVILFFAMKSNLAFGTTNEFSHPTMGYVVFSIVAGFSETLIPNLLVKLESENK